MNDLCIRIVLSRLIFRGKAKKWCLFFSAALLNFKAVTNMSGMSIMFVKCGQGLQIRTQGSESASSKHTL